jgi:hypothetical protein
VKKIEQHVAKAREKTEQQKKEVDTIRRLQEMIRAEWLKSQ